MNKEIRFILFIVFFNTIACAQTNIYKGGSGDGWASLNYAQSTTNIFKGGNGDGWASLNYVQGSTNIFKGGDGDGWTSADTIVITYIFNGNGDWSKPNNWVGSKIPPSEVPAGVQIMINPVPGGECILDVPLTLFDGASLTLDLNAKFILHSNLTLH